MGQCNKVLNLNGRNTNFEYYLLILYLKTDSLKTKLIAAYLEKKFDVPYNQRQSFQKQQHASFGPFFAHLNAYKDIIWLKIQVMLLKGKMHLSKVAPKEVHSLLCKRRTNLNDFAPLVEGLSWKLLQQESNVLLKWTTWSSKGDGDCDGGVGAGLAVIDGSRVWLGAWFCLMKRN